MCQPCFFLLSLALAALQMHCMLLFMKHRQGHRLGTAPAVAVGPPDPWACRHAPPLTFGPINAPPPLNGDISVNTQPLDTIFDALESSCNAGGDAGGVSCLAVQRSPDGLDRWQDALRMAGWHVRSFCSAQ
jgi:hypothetical protein